MRNESKSAVRYISGWKINPALDLSGSNKNLFQSYRGSGWSGRQYPCLKGKDIQVIKPREDRQWRPAGCQTDISDRDSSEVLLWLPKVARALYVNFKGPNQALRVRSLFVLWVKKSYMCDNLHLGHIAMSWFEDDFTVIKPTQDKKCWVKVLADCPLVWLMLKPFRGRS